MLYGSTTVSETLGDGTIENVVIIRSGYSSRIFEMIKVPSPDPVPPPIECVSWKPYFQNFNKIIENVNENFFSNFREEILFTAIISCFFFLSFFDHKLDQRTLFSCQLFKIIFLISFTQFL